MSKRKTIRLIPRMTDVLRTSDAAGAMTQASFQLAKIRKLLTDSRGLPVPVVGTCGYGNWREDKAKRA